MVYAPRRPSPSTNARKARRDVVGGYQQALDALPAHHAASVRAYVAAVHAEAAAQRNEANRLRAALNSAPAGTTTTEGA